MLLLDWGVMEGAECARAPWHCLAAPCTRRAPLPSSPSIKAIDPHQAQAAGSLVATSALLRQLAVPAAAVSQSNYLTFMAPLLSLSIVL